MAESRTILITGSSSGFGHGAARALAEGGHEVFASMRGVEGKNAEVAAELQGWSQVEDKKLQVVEIDVTSDESVARGVGEVLGQAGKIDVLVNNAGVGTWGPQEAFTSDQVQRMLDVNVLGPLRMNRAVLPHMRRAGSGYLIYVSSGLGRIQLPFVGPYAGSKHALEAIAEIGSYELGPMGIETTILQPGAYGTDFLTNSIQPHDVGVIEEQPPVKAMFEAFGSAFRKRAEAGELGDPSEIVDAMVALVESEPGSRPLRKPVGADVQQGVVAINRTCEQVQGQIFKAFGLG
jgi:NAD(P)-dependent dehydrogenase (short-subunit alcohol dehydrogenase family)